MVSEFGVDDILRLGELTWQVYQSLSKAPDVFETLVVEASSMHMMIQLVTESMEQQDISQSVDGSLPGILLTCEAVLHDAQKLVKKYKTLGIDISRRAIDVAGLATEDVAGLRNRFVSAISLLTAYQTTLYGQSNARVIETLENLQRNIQAGNREGSVLSNLAIEDLHDDKRDIWREVVNELEDSGLDPEVIQNERRLITGWLEVTISNGGFDGDLVSDTCSERTVSATNPAYYSRRQSWTSMDSLTVLLAKPLFGDAQTTGKLSANKSPYAQPHGSSSISKTRSLVIRKSLGRILNNNDVRVELAKLKDISASANTVRILTSTAQLPTVLDAKLQPGDVAIDAVISEDLRNAVDYESKIRIQKSRFSRQTLPLPWGWVVDDSLGLYRNNVSSDTAENLPLLDLWSFAVMCYELVPRCIQSIRNNFRTLNNISQQPNSSIQTAAVEEALWSIEILVRAISKFGLLLETNYSPHHIYTEIMVLEEFDRNDELLQSVSISNLVFAQKAYSGLMQQILSSLHAFSLIFSSRNSQVSDGSGPNRIASAWKQKQMLKRITLLEKSTDDEEYWRPVESGLRTIWSQYSDNNFQFTNRSAEIASIWSQFYKTKRGAAGDKITIQIHSAVTTIGDQLKRSHIHLGRIGSVFAVPLVPLDLVRYMVRVLVDGILLFQTAEDERFSPLSRFSWNSTCAILATNCQYVDFEIWDHDSSVGYKRRNRAQAVGRIAFKSPISDAAQFGSEDLNKDVNAMAEVKMISARSGKLWGILKVSLSWVGRHTIAADLIAASGVPVETSESEVLNSTFAHEDYARVTPRVGVIKG